MGRYVDTRGRQPHIRHDSTRRWVESLGRRDSLIKPQAIIRFATDSYHVRNAKRKLYDAPHDRKVYTKAMMNNVHPGQKITGLLNWSVTESLDQVTQTATFDCTNALSLSSTTATVTHTNPAQTVTNDGINNRAVHADTIIGTWAKDSLFAIERVTGPGGRDSNGNKNVEYVKDRFGYYFKEENVQYRLFDHQTFQVNDLTNWPDPAVPDDDDNDVKLDDAIHRELGGAGSYFVLVGNEVMKTDQIDFDTNTLYVPPGGRGVNGIIEKHQNGETVTLLSHGEPTGEWCAMGYLSIQDFNMESAILRPGTYLTSYEGYGDIEGPLFHDFDPTRNYAFTGYWIIDTVEPQLGSDGVPKVSVTVKGPGAMFEEQKINLDNIQRMKNQFGQWHVDGKTLFSAASATRNIPGDWVDYNSWDPQDQHSYPLQIMIEYAQNYAFYQHMQDTQGGLTCYQCHHELSRFKKTHAHETPQTRPVGRHIYKESIRVLREHAGPIKTYIRLMATMSAACWDHPAYGTELSQKFTKIPNQLFDNIRNIYTGMCYNGQIDFVLKSYDPTFDFSHPSYDDKQIISRRTELTCPFQSTYDNVPFSQPMQDLADVNGAFFWVSREGYPVFKPFGWNARSEAHGCRHLTDKGKPDKDGPRFPKHPEHIPGYNGEWRLAYGSSISAYSENIARDQIVTQMWVTASSAFDIDNSSNSFTITAAGTGYTSKGELIFYSPLGGNKDGLGFTGGVQQIDTVSLDNQYLGLDWNTKPASWGVVENEQGHFVTANAKPPLFDGSPVVHKGTPGKSEAVKRVGQAINFLLVRGYLDPLHVSGKYWYTVNVEGQMTPAIREGIKQTNQMLNQSMWAVAGATISGGNFHYHGHSNDVEAWGRATFLAMKEFFKTESYFLMTDIWWYYRNGLTWDQYIAAITGLPVPFKKGHAPKPPNSQKSYSNPMYVIDDKGLQKEVTKWYRTFAQSVINVGNRKVNQTLNQAVTKTIEVGLADPRIMVGDTIYCEIPGHLSSTKPDGSHKKPFNNGIYVTAIQRTLDLEGGTYTGTYSGTRDQGVFGHGTRKAVNAERDFVR